MTRYTEHGWIRNRKVASILMTFTKTATGLPVVKENSIGTLACDLEAAVSCCLLNPVIL